MSLLDALRAGFAAAKHPPSSSDSASDDFTYYTSIQDSLNTIIMHLLNCGAGNRIKINLHIKPSTGKFDKPANAQMSQSTR